jgi:membrane protease YdiL (CAAX protease family)
LSIRREQLPAQVAIALAGAPLGIAAFEILTPAPVISPLTGPNFLGGAFILIVFSAFLEELIFRGLLQRGARELFGRLGLVIVSVLYASLYVGSLSAPYIAFVGAVGLMFAVAVERTGILWGVVGAHSLLNVGLLMVWPTVHG